MIFINYRLFTISGKNRTSNRALSKTRRKSFSVKNIFNYLLAVVCFLVLSILAFIAIGLRLGKEKTPHILQLWAVTFVTMNSTFKCLIFYWKNKSLRQERIKRIKLLKFFHIDPERNHSLCYLLERSQKQITPVLSLSFVASSIR